MSDGERPLLVLLAAYGGPYEGSFVPMARALSAGASGRGWGARLLFSDDAEAHPWYARLRSEPGISAGIAPEGGRRELGRWLGQELEGHAGPAILHTHYSNYDLPAMMAARERERTAVLWHVHTPLYRGVRADLRNAIKYAVLGRSVDAILASGPDPARSVLRLGAPRSRVEVAGSGVATGRHPLASEEERRRARAALGLPADARVLLHFGWDWELKDGDLFLAAMRAMRGSEPRGERVLGLTVSDDPRARATVERLGDPDLVRRAEPMDEVRTLYAGADLFVSSSRVEGQPFAVIEAILSGLPIVATDLRGHHDVCDGLASCRVVEGRSPDALAGAATELLARPPSLTREAAAAARARAVERFDLAPWTGRMLERYERCLARTEEPAA